MIEHLIRQREYLLDISRALTSRLSLKDVLSRILRSATEMLGGQAGLIALAERDVLSVRASYGIPAQLLDYFAPLLADIPRTDPDRFSIPEMNRKMRMIGQAAGLGLHQVIALPMVIGAELIGVIYIFRASGGKFTRNDVKLLQSFADQAAIAAQNALLYEHVVSQSQYLDAVLRHSADGILILNADLTVHSVNLSAARMTGWPVEEARGRPHHELIQWVRREPGNDLSEALASGWPLHDHAVLYVEGDLRHRDGPSTSVGITYAPLFNERGELISIIANMRDISRFREAEEAKSTFVSVVSHELKTPVSIIKGYASTLRRPDVEWKREVVLDGLRVIEEEADRLSALIENLLDATRLQTGRLSLSLREVALDDLARRVAAKFAVQTTIHTLTVDFSEDFPLVRGDEERLEQVFSNLIGNALKYSPDGGEITIRGRRQGSQVLVSVSDQGIGVTAEQREQVFERFYRADNALSRKTQGAGLGLYIVRSIVEAHGGRIWIDPEETQGHGTTFCFTLPLSQG